MLVATPISQIFNLLILFMKALAKTILWSIYIFLHLLRVLMYALNNNDTL